MNYHLITTYKLSKDKELSFSFFNTFINFYRKEWNVKKEIVLIGIPKEVHDSDPNIEDFLMYKINKISNLKSLKYEKIEGINKPHINNVAYYSTEQTDFVLYITDTQTSYNSWNEIKRILFTICKSRLVSNIDRVINIDNDEFLVRGRNEKQELKTNFHFLEIVPPEIGKTFSVNEEMKWCIQPWYYRNSWKNNDYNGDITHNGCKLFSFDKMDICNPWQHTNGSNIHCQQFDIKDLEKFNVAYHLSCLDYEYYLKIKTKNFKESQTDETYLKQEQEIKNIYKKYYYDTKKYPIVTNNFLRSYWID